MGEYEYSGTISHDVEFEYFPFEVGDKSQFAIDIIKEHSKIADYDYWKIQLAFKVYYFIGKVAIKFGLMGHKN